MRSVTTFGTLLRRHRVEAKLSQEELAARAAVSPKAVSASECGVRRHPYAATVSALADALHLAGSSREEFRESAGRRGTNGVGRGISESETVVPAFPTSFVGRAAEIEDLLGLVQAHRLLTITGAGGVGKTRLAVQVAQHPHRHWRDGASFVDLASVGELDLVPATIASAIGVGPGDGNALRSLTAHMRSLHALLILDNCEHVLPSVSAIAHAIIRDCPRVTIIATSRERLGLAGEVVYRIQGLDIPDERVEYSNGRSYAAPALFVDRASSADPRFVLTEARYRTIVDVCRRLDGMPLAIELAAARMPALGLPGLRDQLNLHFSILSNGGPDLPDRQRTMIATIAWSYAALSDTERMLLRRLAVFAGGFTLDAAEDVCADEGAVEEIVPALVSLVEKSLVAPDFDGPDSRYRLLESTREFSWGMFLESPDCCAVRRRHAEWLAAFADRAYGKYLRMSRQAWMALVEPWLNNARAALTWALGPDGDATLAGRIVGGLRGMWRTAGLHLECRRWALASLEQIDVARTPDVAAQVFRALALVSNGRERVAAARRAEALLRGTEDLVGLATSLVLMTQGLIQAGSFAEALPVIDEAVDLLQRCGMDRSLFQARAFYERCAVLRGLDQNAEVAAQLDEALMIAHAFGDEEIALDVHYALAEAAFDAGDVMGALRRADVALQDARRLRWDAIEITILNSIAAYHIALEQYDDAGSAAERALSLSRDREPLGFCLSLQHLATVAAARGMTATAARLLGFVDARLDRESYERNEAERRAHARLRTLVANAVEPCAVPALVALGAAYDDDSAATEALSSVRT